MLSELGPARKLANRPAMSCPQPALELAVRITAKLTFLGAGRVVRQDVSLPAEAAAGTRKFRVVDHLVSDPLVSALPATRASAE
jgi:hypothetical protein